MPRVPVNPKLVEGDGRPYLKERYQDAMKQVEQLNKKYDDLFSFHKVVLETNQDLKAHNQNLATTLRRQAAMIEQLDDALARARRMLMTALEPWPQTSVVNQAKDGASQ